VELVERYDQLVLVSLFCVLLETDRVSASECHRVRMTNDVVRMEDAMIR